MNLYIVRHGSTSWNKEKRIQGKTDISLDADGKKEALKLKETLKDIPFDLCISSPLKRAKETATIIVDNKYPIIYDDLLQERDYGLLEGTIYSVTDAETLKYWDYKLNSEDKEVESLQALLKRAQMFIQKLQDEYSHYENILIVSHACLIKCLYYNFNGYTPDTDFMSYYLKNGELYKIELK